MRTILHPKKSLQISAGPKGSCRPVSLQHCERLYDNDYSLIIDIFFYETFSTLTQLLALALNSLYTLSDIRIKAFMLLF